MARRAELFVRELTDEEAAHLFRSPDCRGLSRRKWAYDGGSALCSTSQCKDRRERNDGAPSSGSSRGRDCGAVDRLEP